MVKRARKLREQLNNPHQVSEREEAANDTGLHPSDIYTALRFSKGLGLSVGH